MRETGRVLLEAGGSVQGLSIPVGRCECAGTDGDSGV